MKCFLLELHVILRESRNPGIDETVENLIILANNSLSSSGVSYQYSYRAMLDIFAWLGEVISNNGQADPSKGTRERELILGVTCRRGTVTSVHTILNHSLLTLIQRLLHDARYCASELEWQWRKSQVTDFEVFTYHQVWWIDVNLIT